mgnify:CR=1 FL=1
MNFLGINAGHGASCALMINGMIKLVYQEERFKKIKNFGGYPRKSIENCLKYVKQKKIDIDIAAFVNTNPNLAAYKYPIYNYFNVKDYNDFYGDKYYSKLLANKSVKKYFETLDKDKRNKASISLERKKLDCIKNGDFNELNNFLKSSLQKQSKGLIKKIIFADHHSCHAHYAYFSLSRKEIKKNKICVLTIDSQGDGINQTLWLPSKNKKNIINIYRTNTCDIARIYKLVTLILSMKPNEHEYKVMGMAPYSKGKYSKEIYEKVFKNILKVKNCKVVHKNRPKNLYNYLKQNLEQYRFDNISGAVQMFVEKITSNLLKQINSKYKVNCFSISGGVSMNIKANKVLSELNFVKKIYVPPTGTDDSLSIGACYYLSKSKSESLNNIYLGQNLFTNEPSIEEQINSKFKDKKKFLIKKNVSQNQVARLLLNGAIIAIAQGREEFGARALGNRSIIANPSHSNVIKTINEMIKNRDFWMPFALSIIYEKHKNYIINKKQILSEFMTIGFDTKENNLHQIKAGTHPYDFTVRPQMLKFKKNKNYYNLISKFYGLSGIPAVLNTSLNLHGYPISSDLNDVYKTFKNSGLKYLFLENKYLIIKK